MTDFVCPNDFTSNTTALSAQVNANFTAIETFLNATGVPVIQNGAVDTAAKLGAGVVTHAKMDSKALGQQATGGYAQIAANVGTVAQTVNAVSITVTGDGITPLTIEGSCLAFGSASAGSSTDVSLALLDGSTQIAEDVFDAHGVNDYKGGYLKRTIPAFSGSKTFHLNLTVPSGSGTLYATSAKPAWIRATWAPGYSTS